MIEFRVIKYKHYRHASELYKKVQAGLSEDREIFAFALTLVKSWDWVDAETGQPLPLEESSLDEMTESQIAMLGSVFQREFGASAEVPKSGEDSAG